MAGPPLPTACALAVTVKLLSAVAPVLRLKLAPVVVGENVVAEALSVSACVLATTGAAAKPIAPPTALLLVNVIAEPAKSSGLVKVLAPMVLPDTSMVLPEVTSSAPESVCAFTVPVNVDAFKDTEPVPLVVSMRPTVISPLFAVMVTLAVPPIHNSEPMVPLLASKNSMPLTLSIALMDEPALRLMSLTRTVPEAVPSLRHSSFPVVESWARK